MSHQSDSLSYLFAKFSKIFVNYSWSFYILNCSNWRTNIGFQTDTDWLALSTNQRWRYIWSFSWMHSPRPYTRWNKILDSDWRIQTSFESRESIHTQKMFRTDQLLLHRAEVYYESYFYDPLEMSNEDDSPVNDRQIFHPWYLCFFFPFRQSRIHQSQTRFVLGPVPISGNFIFALRANFRNFLHVSG